MREVDDGGAPIAVEVWALSPAAFGTFVARIPPPLCIGSLALADGTRVSGFLAEPHALAAATDITRFGGWRAYLAGTSSGGYGLRRPTTFLIRGPPTALSGHD